MVLKAFSLGDITALSLASYQPTLTITALFLLLLLTKYINRLFFHPLSKFPGPPIAAASHLWEFWQDMVCDGTFLQAIPKLHKRYNSAVVRISPNHLHINDPEFYHKVFKVSTDFYKAPYFYEAFGFATSLATITNPDRHKPLRTVIAPMFTGSVVDEMSGEVYQMVCKATSMILKSRQRAHTFNVMHFLRCLTTDINCDLIFGQNLDLVESGYHSNEFLNNLDIFIKNVWIMVHAPWIARFALLLPNILTDRLVPGYAYFRKQCIIWIEGVRQRRAKGITTMENGRPTLFDVLLTDNPDKAYKVPANSDLVDQAFLFAIAGTDTTSMATTFAIFHILSNPKALSTLREELLNASSIIRSEYNYRKVRKLPYLSAVIKEALRMSSPFPGRLPRVVPPQGTELNNEFIPGGTIISISSRCILDNEDLFPEPEKFMPERWMGENSRSMERWMIAFGKGSRSCLAMNLAYLKMYTMISVIFSRFDLRLVSPTGPKLHYLDHALIEMKSAVEVEVLVDNWEK
ncbi:cytochrome P450 [Penicillium malachiteum]|uniref:Cytochrome P450 n=1 Tax=Penicillium malachiteum TaxID=1324776 RepID=A0AAD6HNT2_9EURO|nr:cytochrome P450 [Penicillium malachiteum]